MQLENQISFADAVHAHPIALAAHGSWYAGKVTGLKQRGALVQRFFSFVTCFLALFF